LFYKNLYIKNFKRNFFRFVSRHKILALISDKIYFKNLRLYVKVKVLYWHIIVNVEHMFVIYWIKKFIQIFNLYRWAFFDKLNINFNLIDTKGLTFSKYLRFYYLNTMIWRFYFDRAIRVWRDYYYKKKKFLMFYIRYIEWFFLYKDHIRWRFYRYSFKYIKIYNLYYFLYLSIGFIINIPFYVYKRFKNSKK